MQPYEIVRAALQEAPGDTERLLAWFINSAPPIQRETIHARIAGAVASGRLTGEFGENVRAPRLFTASAASRVWDDLVEALKAQGVDDGEARSFFKPDDHRFAPQAYPPRWSPVVWNLPLSPAEVRGLLKINERDTRELVEIVEAMAGANKPSVFGIGSGGDIVRRLAGKRLRVGVLPYGDGLPMVTLIYAVSDLVDGIEFGPSSFYRPISKVPTSIGIEDGIFNVGYATAFQLSDKLKKDHGLICHEVWAEGFTRSLLLRINNLSRANPQLRQLSFVGQFGPFGSRHIDPDRSDPIFAKLHRTNLQFEETMQISENIDPIVNWEIPLILAFASGMNGFSQEVDGLVLTVSTDAHLWAASFGLNLGPSESRVGSASELRPTFRHAAWDPAQQGEGSLEGIKSQLCWFIPEVGARAKGLRDRLNYLVASLIENPIRTAMRDYDDCADCVAVQSLRKELTPLAQSLLAPLLTALPGYSGPMLAAPPDAWMRKILGPSLYIEDRPRWFGRVTSGETVSDGEASPLTRTQDVA